jgi:hypothetical protein
MLVFQPLLALFKACCSIDLLVLTCLDRLLLKQQHYLLFYKTSILNEEVNRTEPSLLVSVPCYKYEDAQKGLGTLWP